MGYTLYRGVSTSPDQAHPINLAAYFKTCSLKSVMDAAVSLVHYLSQLFSEIKWIDQDVDDSK